MRRLLVLWMVSACLCAAPAARADGDEPDAPEDGDAVLTRSQVVGDISSARPTPIDPIHGIHAEAIFGSPAEGIGLFANSQGFSLSRRTALYHMEGGASLPLDDGVRLTASYRILGMDFGYDSDVERADVEPGLSAPFLGLVFDF